MAAMACLEVEDWVASMPAWLSTCVVSACDLLTVSNPYLDKVDSPAFYLGKVIEPELICLLWAR